jgi:hypothetical protein
VPYEAIRVTGLRELQRACNASEREVRLGVRAKLREAAEPVRARAEELAVGSIRNIGPVWSRMRVGVTPGAVYVAPRARRRGGSPRPNLGGLLMRERCRRRWMTGATRSMAVLELALDEIADRNW